MYALGLQRASYVWYSRDHCHCSNVEQIHFVSLRRSWRCWMSVLTMRRHVSYQPRVQAFCCFVILSMHHDLPHAACGICSCKRLVKTSQYPCPAQRLQRPSLYISLFLVYCLFMLYSWSSISQPRKQVMIPSAAWKTRVYPYSS